MNRSSRIGLTLVELLVVLSIIGLLAGLLLPAIQAAREGGRRTRCINNLKQLELGVLEFEALHQKLPSGGWGKRWAGLPDQGIGKSQPGGWIYQTLPFIEQQFLHNLGGSNISNFDDNSQRLSTPLAVLHCPSRRSAEAFANPRPWIPFYCTPIAKLARNDYAANGGSVYVRYSPGPSSIQESRTYDWPEMRDNTGLFFQHSEIRFRDISDGLTNTYLLGEKHVPRAGYYSGEDWGDNESAYSGDDRDLIRYTGQVSEMAFSPLGDFMLFTPDHDPLGGTVFGSAHSNSFQMGMSDGSVRSVDYSVDGRIHSLLGSRNDGQSIDDVAP